MSKEMRLIRWMCDQGEEEETIRWAQGKTPQQFWDEAPPRMLLSAATRYGVLSKKELDLFGCACARMVWHLLLDLDLKKTVELIESKVGLVSLSSEDKVEMDKAYGRVLEIVAALSDKDLHPPIDTHFLEDLGIQFSGLDIAVIVDSGVFRNRYMAARVVVVLLDVFNQVHYSASILAYFTAMTLAVNCFWRHDQNNSEEFKRHMDGTFAKMATYLRETTRPDWSILDEYSDTIPGQDE